VEFGNVQNSLHLDDRPENRRRGSEEILGVHSMNAPRRLVAGLDSDGRSRILIDDVSQTVIWSNDRVPAENSGATDRGHASFDFPVRGVRFSFHDFPPGTQPYMHATDTIDYVVVVAGEIIFITETGEVRLCAGDTLINRGIIHAWRNESRETCRIVTVVCEAHPVGRGGTM
jgi:quercetin dioxygenase-like cupin family protein